MKDLQQIQLFGQLSRSTLLYQRAFALELIGISATKSCHIVKSSILGQTAGYARDSVAGRFRWTKQY